jgi:hypothetical protein
LPRWFRMVSIAMAVLPVWRSPRINSRWPRPMGMSASTTFRPVCKGTMTGARSMMGGAGRSTGRRSSAATGPLPSRGLPSGSITRPSKPSPTATSMTRPGALDLVARVQVLIFAKQDDADLVLVHVECDAEQIAREPNQLIEAHAGKARDGGDARGDIRRRADFTRRQLRREGFAGLAQAGEGVVDGRLQDAKGGAHWAPA